MFKKLTKEEEQEFKVWAREHYTAHSDISTIWHPVTQLECHKMCIEELEARIEACRLVEKE